MEDGVFVHFEEHYVPFDIWFEVDAYPTKDGLAIFGRDVTERRRFNDRLQQTQKLESLGVLAGGIAHDFNNLLTGIMGNASIVLDDLPSESPVRENLEAVMKASERAAVLTRQLLAYAGKGRFVIEPLNLSELAREITSLLQTSIPRTVELRLQLQEDLPSIEGDAAQIQQLVMNLVINAAEAVEEGQTETVWIITRLEQVSQAYINQMISPNGVAPGKYVTLEVRDAGCGMDAETLSRIFDPFFTTKFTGRGLGLAAVMGMVRGHKGALHVESTPGKGSCFKVLFPVTAEAAASIVPSSQEKSLAGDETILVIDDEDTVRQAAKSALESYGYKVVVAANGKEGVRLFQELAGRDRRSAVGYDHAGDVGRRGAGALEGHSIGYSGGVVERLRRGRRDAPFHRQGARRLYSKAVCGCGAGGENKDRAGIPRGGTLPRASGGFRQIGVRSYPFTSAPLTLPISNSIPHSDRTIQVIHFS